MAEGKTFKLDLEALPLSENAKRRIVKGLQVAVVKELAAHDDGPRGVIILDGIRGGKMLRDVAAFREMPLGEIMKLGE